jgi:outer membrane protein TolC
MHSIRCLLLAFLVLTPVAASADDSAPKVVVLTRAETIRRVLRENAQLRAADADVMIAEARQGQVNAAKYPSIDLTGGIATSIAADNTDADENGVQSRRSAYGDFNINQVRPAFVARLSVVQPLYTFGKIGQREKAAQAGLEAAQAQRAITAAELAVEVAELYEAHLFGKEIVLFMQDVKGVATRSIEETKDRLEAGAFDVTEQDRLRLETALGAAQLAENYARAVISQTLDGLRAYLNLPPGTEVQVSEQYLDPVSKDASTLEQLIVMAKEQRPEIVALSRGIQAYDHLAAAERADFYPNIFVLGYLSAVYTVDRDLVQSRFVLDPLGHVFTGALVGARWTLQWDMAAHRAEEVKAESFRLGQLLEWAQAGVPAEVNRYQQEVIRARADLKQLETTLPLTKRWVVRASADFGAGFGDSRGVVDAVQAFVIMKNNQLDAVFRLNTNLAQLAKATGTLTEQGPSFLYPGEAP